MYLYVRIYIPIEYPFSYKEVPFKIMMGETWRYSGYRRQKESAKGHEC